MATYLLLRDNRESGPHSVNDLVKLGLKAYDLVWVEGRSAAWRYPSEIDELKPYAPVAEEQPFDRFFKKPPEEKKEERPPVQQAPEQQFAPLPVEAKAEFTPKKSVFVTLPGGQQNQPVAQFKKEPSVTPAAAQPNKKPTPAPPPAFIEDDEPEVAEIKYSQPLDEIKEMYVKTLQQRKSKIAKKSFLVATMKRAAVIGALIGLGVLAGYIFRSKPANSSTITQQIMPTSAALTNDVSAGAAESPGQQENANSEEITETETGKTGKQYLKVMPDEPGNMQEQPTIRIRKETMITPKEKKEFDDQQVSPGVDIDAATGERNRKVRNSDGGAEPKAVLKTNRNTLNDQVSVSSNDYKRVAFGGIRNLQLTVTNNSKYELDNVIVELQYLKPSEEPLRTENIRFKGIAPNESATLKVPDTNRGIKVSYKIISIESRHHTDDVAGM